MISKFKELPISIKLVVICLLILGLGSFWKTASVYIETKASVELATLIRGVIECGLAVGLVNKSNEARQWTAFFTGLSLIGNLFLLAIAVFENPTLPGGLKINYGELSQPQAIMGLILFFVLNAGILVVLTRPLTRSFFVTKNNREDD